VRKNFQLQVRKRREDNHQFRNYAEYYEGKPHQLTQDQEFQINKHDWNLMNKKWKKKKKREKKTIVMKKILLVMKLILHRQISQTSVRHQNQLMRKLVLMNQVTDLHLHHLLHRA